MTEPRMRTRPKGPQFASSDLEAFLIAHGDSFNPLPQTIRTLDEIITDYIIETCHAAALVAQTSHRAKIKVDDFKFALRKDQHKLGRVTELLVMERDIRKRRKAFDTEDEIVAKEGKGRRKADDENNSTKGRGKRGADGESVTGNGTTKKQKKA